MKQIHIVSNRLPVKIEFNEKEIITTSTVGGLATGMSSVYKKYDGSWIGWASNSNDSDFQKEIIKALAKHKCLPVFLSDELYESYYEGFSNKTIWPLYHYFTQYVEYDQLYWDAYQMVNEIFAEVIISHAKEDDYIWIHDYHLQLLPKLVKDRRPDLIIGYFLHIPFPSYEVFRILPWRNDIIDGLLGADLIGFHTYDYERHFLSSVRRLLGYDITFNEITVNNRTVKVDVFPMGIDYNKFHDTAVKHQQLSIRDRSEIQQQIDKHYLAQPDQKLILSIDRLDYSKGIANRLEAFEYFLEKYPDFRQKVSLIMVSVPSRTSVEHYQQMKSEVDKLVGRINGRFASLNWTPIWYFYRSIPFDSLIDLYTSCEIGLLTPIRDGMNLVAKEFVASKTDQKGVLILSEMAGAAKEMSEALIINPNNYDEIAEALKTAMLMSNEEQMERISIMQKRLNRYNVNKWANDFVESLEKTQDQRQQREVNKITPFVESSIIEEYKKAKKRILFLDYDGTLVGFKNKPQDAKPDEELFTILDNLAAQTGTEIVLISGRDKETFTQWFAGRNYSMITEHGIWQKYPDEEWIILEPINCDWKEMIHPILEFYVDRTPGSFIEEKNYSLVWHYRKVDPELGNMRAIELSDELTSLIANYNLDILEGSKVIEIKNSGINKGRGALHRLGNYKYDFIFAAGDDWTDEYLFEELSDRAITVKIGIKNTKARYNIESVDKFRHLLAEISKL